MKRKWSLNPIAMKKQRSNPNSFSNSEKQKAIDALLWKNFEARNKDLSYKLFQKQGKDDFLIQEARTSEGMYNLYSTSVRQKSYKKMKYSHIQKIAQDSTPLYHWEEIRGLFSSFDGELLRYILHAQIPLEKFIRYELASRGFDKAHHWVGFEKAEKIWLK